jgi:hypothetical protein
LFFHRLPHEMNIKNPKTILLIRREQNCRTILICVSKKIPANVNASVKYKRYKKIFRKLGFFQIETNFRKQCVRCENFKTKNSMMGNE